MKVVCQYSVARFLPYVETGEFANFGIVLHCPETGYFGYRLLKAGTSRINAFFDELAPVIFRRARNTLQEELRRIELRIGETPDTQVPTSGRFLAELARPREAIIRFSDIRAVMTDNPEMEIERLFNHYVQRAFVTPEYKDRLVEKAVKRILTERGVAQGFTRAVVSGDGYHATFPFVKREENGTISRIIKPLHLGDNDGTKIFNHAWRWVGQIERLHELNALPQDILIPVKAPSNDNTDAYVQYEAARRKLIETGAEVVSIDDTQVIARFAARE